MASAFIGLSVVVKLRPPRGWLLRGLVVDVRDQQLFLENVVDLNTHWLLGALNVPGFEIEDIEVAAADATTRPEAQTHAHVDTPPGTVQDASAARQQHEQGIFLRPAAPTPPVPAHANGRPGSDAVDPAIVSFTRTPSAAAAAAAAAAAQPQPRAPPASSPVSATLTRPFSDSISGSGQDATQTQPAEESSRAKTGPQASKARNVAKQSKPAQSRQTQSRQVQASAAPEVVSNQKPAGWRQTPILIDPGANAKTQDSKKKSRKNLQRLHFEEQYGEASDYADLPDFDFAGNNAKFDKRAAFDQIRNEDTTADEDRLVSHNRLPKPGTFGGSKLHPTESVLDRPIQSANDPAAASSDDDDDSDDDNSIVVAGNVAAALDASISSLKLQSSRSSSTRRKDSMLTRETLGHVSRSSSQARLAKPLNKPASSTAVEVSSPSLSASAKTRKAGLLYGSTRQACLAIPASTIQAAERQATTPSKLDGQAAGPCYSLTQDILAENAGRAIADLALSAINLGGRRAARGAPNPDPVVVILVGECEAGARAICAGRHMLERGVRVVVSLPDADDQVALGLGQAHVERQLARFRGTQMEWEELQAHLKTLDAPPELIVDALFGIETRFSALGPARRAVALQMMAWANKSKASVLAVDLPSGVDPDSGAVEVFEGEPAEVRARVVLACGAPCTGLLRALQLRNRHGDGPDWRMFVCDVGITPALQDAVKKKYRGAIAFGHAWTVPIVFDDAASG